MKEYKNKNFIIGAILLVIFLSFFVYLNSGNSYPDAIHGKVLRYSVEKSGNSKNNRYSNIDVKITTGKYKDKIIKIENNSSSHINDEGSNAESFAVPGDEVLLNVKENAKGEISSAYIFEIVRYKYIYNLGAFFIILILLLGGIKGLKSIIALMLTGIIVVKIMIPLILAGLDPVILSIVICIIVTVINLYIIYGKNTKTIAAIIGTLGGLFVSGIIALISNKTLRLKGLPDEEVQSIIYASQNPNFMFGGLLFAGIIMGALGAVMDVSISIASSMKEIKDANPEIEKRELVKVGLNVGRDIMGSMSNTLILAYVGGAMYIMMMIVSNGMGLSKTINQDIIASEIIRGLAGSIGLVFSIPLTALAFAFLYKKR